MSHATRTWSLQARDDLRRLWQRPGGWGPDTHGTQCPATTVLACLALLAGDDEPALPDTLEWVDACAQGLADLQRAMVRWVLRISVPPCAARPRTPPCCGGSYCITVGRWPTALRYLQQCDELAPSATEDGVPGRGLTHEVGSCSAGMHWQYEPIALTILSLCRNELTGHRQIADSTRWLLEQSLVGGGWPAGPCTPAGQLSTADVASTGIVLLALCAAGVTEVQEVTMACHYLDERLPRTRGSEGLSWGLLGYRAWRPHPPAAQQWLCRSCAESRDTAASSAAPRAPAVGCQCPLARVAGRVLGVRGRGETARGTAGVPGGVSCARAPPCQPMAVRSLPDPTS